MYHLLMHLSCLFLSLYKLSMLCTFHEVNDNNDMLLKGECF